LHRRYDAVVLGGGINGCAIARKLSQEGMRVVLLERGAIGGGTSANSSKLIHGGLRYLENGQFDLVKESLKDRQRLAKLYPDLVRMVPFYLPVYQDSLRPGWMIRLGLLLYDAFSRQRAYHSREVNQNAFLNRFPNIKPEGLRRVYVYYDGKTDDQELTRRLACDARENGGVVQEYCSVSDISLADGGWAVSYTDSQGEQQLKAPLLINVTGPWIDEVNERYGLPHNYRITRVSGIHIVINRELVPDCLFLQTRTKRIFFMIPWREGKTIIGTTERVENCPCDAVQINEFDIDYLLACANRYLRNPVNKSDIVDTFLGIRPLIMDKRVKDVSQMSREYKLDVVEYQGAKLIHVFGGKLTTCLSMAEKVWRRI
jgi:glycerol-3-phosphate dehydrogenase